MTHLDNLIELINEEIKGGLTSLNFSVNGLVRKTEKNKEVLNYDINEKPIFFDSSMDLYLYHFNISSSHEKIQGPGKKYIYSITERMELICYSKHRNSREYLTNKLANIKDLLITGVDSDSMKIFKEETGKDIFDLNHYVFKINYDLKYKSDKCNECLINC